MRVLKQFKGFPKGQVEQKKKEKTPVSSFKALSRFSSVEAF